MGKHQEALDVPAHTRYLGVEPSEIRISYGDMTAVLLVLWELFPERTMTIRFSTADTTGISKQLFTIFGMQKVGHNSVLTLGIPYDSKSGRKAARIHVMYSELSSNSIIEGLQATGLVSKEIYVNHQERPFSELDRARGSHTKKIPSQQKATTNYVTLDDPLDTPIRQKKELRRVRDGKDRNQRNFNVAVNDHLKGIGVNPHPMKRSDLMVLFLQLKHRFKDELKQSTKGTLTVSLIDFSQVVKFFTHSSDPDGHKLYGIAYTLVANGLANWAGNIVEVPEGIEILINEPI